MYLPAPKRHTLFSLCYVFFFDNILDYDKRNAIVENIEKNSNLRIVIYNEAGYVFKQWNFTITEEMNDDSEIKKCIGKRRIRQS